MTKFSQISTTALLFFIAFIICLLSCKLESSSPPDIPGDTSDEGFSTGIPIGVALGVLLCLALATIPFLACGCWKQQQKDDAPSAAEGTKTLKRYTMEDLREMTNNFDAENLLGKGGSASVYRGQGSDGTKVAIKKIDMSRAQGTQDYESEFSALARISHRNIVSLLGHFGDQNERFLVFEYAPQGTLESRLFQCQEKGFEPLSWKQRLTIALDVARGLDYLHSCLCSTIVHRDLKPANILLDDDLRALIADFGLARHLSKGEKSMIIENLEGTGWYMAPEYRDTGEVSTKVDVFSYGVMVLELITGKRFYDNDRPAENRSLLSMFMRSQVHTTADLIDPTLDRNEETLRSFEKVAGLARNCCIRNSDQRPEISDAMSVLLPLVCSWKPLENVREDHVVPPRQSDVLKMSDDE